MKKSTRTVLLVENEEMLQTAWERLLARSHPHIVLIQPRSIDEASTALECFVFDLVVVSGKQLGREESASFIREIRRRGYGDVIVLSSLSPDHRQALIDADPSKMYIAVDKDKILEEIIRRVG